VRIEGPAMHIRPKAALLLCMVLHELATNAAKYGALSDCGVVNVTWSFVNDDPDAKARLRFEWAESDGPPCSPPEHKGFGSTMIERGVPYELDGEVELRYPRDGVNCVLMLPLDKIT
jgi:two-component system CheB/CheR fusion protein